MFEQDCNILIDALPLTVEVGGRDIPIYANFRTGILFEMLVQDAEIPKPDKVLAALELFFPEENLPYVAEHIDEASEMLLWFYSCGRPEKKTRSTSQKSRPKTSFSKRIYDFNIDAPLIYAAFLAQYGVDLQEVEFLHWWKFCAMFDSLTDNHEITKIMGYRAVELSDIKNKHEKNRLAKLQARYALPTIHTTEEKQQIAGAIFGGAMR